MNYSFIFPPGSTWQIDTTMVVEVKLEVSSDLTRMSKGKLLQAFVEGYYTIQEHEKNYMLVCITDLIQFHVLKVKRHSSHLLSVEAASSINAMATSYTDTLHMLAECLLAIL